MQIKKQKKWRVLSGNFLEFYEFTLFSALIPIIAPLLFASKELIQSYTSGYLFLLIAFLARPIGAVFFGYIGDQYGRKKALLWTILMMSVATFGLGLLPEKNPTIIVYFLLAVLRLLQGFSAGGEYFGAGLLIVENHSRKETYFNGSLLTAFGLLGASTASFAAASLVLMEKAIEYWRLLFIIGGLVGFILFFFRVTLQETHQPVRNSQTWKTLFLNYKRPLFFTIIIGGLMNVPFQMITSFINTYFIAIGAYSKPTLMITNACIILFCAFVTVCFGNLSKKRNPLFMMLTASGGMALLGVPLYWLLETKNFYAFVGAEMILIMLSQLFVAPAFGVLTQIYPVELRYRGMAIGVSTGLALFGGGAPYISVFLITQTGISWMPGVYLTILAAITYICVLNIGLRYKLKI